MSLGEPDPSGRRRPQPVPGSEHTLIADSVIKAIGQQPHREAAGWFGGLDFDGSRLAIDPATLQTSNPKVFAGGDVVGGTSVVQAVRDGKHAATAIQEWLCRS
jgi:glutamate synthase (NADPH/NADH) small chain